MKLTDEQEKVCGVFSQVRDGKVNCANCPMVLNTQYCVCLKNVSKKDARDVWDWDGDPYPALHNRIDDEHGK